MLDIDECTDGTHKSDVNGAVCIDTPGSYNCTCENGFVGDGRNCTGKLYIDTIDRRVFQLRCRRVFQLRCMLCYSDVLSTLFEKHSFISTISPAVHTNLSGNGALRKRSSKRKYLKTPALGLFRIQGRLKHDVIFLVE